MEASRIGPSKSATRVKVLARPKRNWCSTAFESSIRLLLAPVSAWLLFVRSCRTTAGRFDLSRDVAASLSCYRHPTNHASLRNRMRTLSKRARLRPRPSYWMMAMCLALMGLLVNRISLRPGVRMISMSRRIRRHGLTHNTTHIGDGIAATAFEVGYTDKRLPLLWIPQLNKPH